VNDNKKMENKDKDAKKTPTKTSTHKQKNSVYPKTVSLQRKTDPEQLYCKSDF